MEDPLALENRRAIYTFIEERPGAHLREMERELGLSIGVLTYHLVQLEKSELVRTFDDGYMRKYFCNKDFDLRQRKSISILGSRQAQRIVLLLLSSSPLRFKDLAMKLEITKPTLTYHVKKLVKAEIISSTRIEGDVAYILQDREHVLACMVIISGKKDVINSFAQIWEDLKSK